MKDSNDIANLYKTLGQNPNQYQEVVRDEELAQANERWPLIAAMHDSDFSPPPVDQKKRGPRERAPIVVLEHENELEVEAHDYHQRVETVKAIELLADPAMTPSWAPAMHDVPEVIVSPEPAQDLIETGWIAPERTAAQIELAAQAAQAVQAAHQLQAIKEAQAAKDAQAQRDAEAALEEQAELAAEATKAAQVVQDAQAARDAPLVKDVQAAREAQVVKDSQAAREAQVVKAAQAAREQQVATVKTANQAPKSAVFVPPVQVAVVAQKLASDVEVIKKAVATVGTSIFQDDTKVAFAGAPASIFSESTLAESLMDEAASEYDELGDDLEAFIEEEIAPVVANPRRQRVAVEPVAPAEVIAAAPAKVIVAAPAVRKVEKPMLAAVSEPGSVVSLTHMRMRASGEPQPLAALFSRLSGSTPTASGVAEGKKSLLFERMKRT
ncbi:MAG: cellulose biosynthesis protein BcsP [Burkholderiaceae bacterium]|nr:cellulose biosynthesis protein BcsP [Burkholderiaceae bacterium]